MAEIFCCIADIGYDVIKTSDLAWSFFSNKSSNPEKYQIHQFNYQHFKNFSIKDEDVFMSFMIYDMMTKTDEDSQREADISSPFMLLITSN